MRNLPTTTSTGLLVATLVLPTACGFVPNLHMKRRPRSIRISKTDVQPPPRTSAPGLLPLRAPLPFPIRIGSTSSSSNDSDKEINANNSNNDDNEEEEEEAVAPNQMKVSEIKAELDLRDVGYGDCFDKESLAERLNTARAQGRSDPQILDRFNKQNLEQAFDPTKKIKISEQDLDAAVARDGTLPGGMRPDQFMALAESPEIMALLQNTKMQEAMKIMMTGGREKLEAKLKEDPELQEIVKMLDEVINNNG